MAEFSYRTHTAGELNLAHVGREVVLLGWVHRVRDLGGRLFFDLRDRYGLTQVVVRDRQSGRRGRRPRAAGVRRRGERHRRGPRA